MDDKVKNIIMKKLKDWEGESITVSKLAELREIITKKTGKHKFLPYVNLRKWVREVKKEMRAMNKQKSVSTQKTVAKTTAAAKPEAKVQSAPSAIISPFADRVYFQNLTYELTSMRRTLERISKQLDELETQLNEFKEGKPE